MLTACTTTDLPHETINAFKNEDGNLVVQRPATHLRVIHITQPKELAGTWISSNPNIWHVPEYGPQGLIYNPAAPN